MWLEFDWNAPGRTTVRSDRPSLRRHRASPTIFNNDRAGAWEYVVAERIVKLRCLPVGWDGYKGRPLTHANAIITASMLSVICRAGTPAPALVPLPSGGVQIEWHRGHFDLEITVYSPGKISALFCDDRADDDGEELEIAADFSHLIKFVRAIEQEG